MYDTICAGRDTYDEGGPLAETGRVYEKIQQGTMVQLLFKAFPGAAEAVLLQPLSNTA